MVETAAYQVLEHIREIELRKYPTLIVATVSDLQDDSAFPILFKFISGENRIKERVAMTTPVITSERIDMTAPVISDATTMSFVMPSRFSKEQIPDPLDTRVQIQEILPRIVAVIRFKGYADEESVAEMKMRLLSTLKERGIQTVGQPFLMRYNAPFTPGFLRRNEIGIEVIQEKV